MADDIAAQFRRILTVAAADAGVAALAGAAPPRDGGAWHQILLRAHPDVPFVAWLRDQGLAWARPSGVVLPVWCTDATAHAFARQLHVRAAAAGQHLEATAAWPGEHPGEAYLRRPATAPFLTRVPAGPRTTASTRV